MKDKYHEPLRPEDPVRSTQFLDNILRRYDIDLTSEKGLLSMQWKNIAGPDFCDVSSFRSIENGVLTISCRNASYAAALRLNKNEIIKKINTIFPQIVIEKVIILVSKNV